MNICLLAAGAAGMYCGSCMRDNALAGALRRAGHQVLLLPLYSPLRSDEPVEDCGPIFFGGLNVFLRQRGGWLAAMSRTLRGLLDRPALLRLAARLGGSASPRRLGQLTLGMLTGADGPHHDELSRMLDFVATQSPDIVSMPNAMFVGLAPTIRERLGAPVVCELTGEDIFLDALPTEYRAAAIDLIARGAHHVDRFVATSAYYARRAADLFRIDRSRIHVVWPGIDADDLLAIPPPAHPRPPAIAYLARACPAKGLHRLISAAVLLRRQAAFGNLRVLAAGWLGASDRAWFNRQVRGPAAALDGAFCWLGSVDRAGKRTLLAQADVLCVPAEYPEAKGLYVLEAAAAGIPVVLPDHGSFGELVAATNAGVLVAPNDDAAMARALGELLSDIPRRAAMATAGRLAVRQKFTADAMAQGMLNVWNAARMERL